MFNKRFANTMLHFGTIPAQNVSNGRKVLRDVENLRLGGARFEYVSSTAVR